MGLFDIAGVLFSGASGGIVGAVGGLLSKVIEMRQQTQTASLKIEADKARYAHEASMQQLANDSLKMEIEANFKNLQTEASMAYDKSSFDALKSSYENDKATYATGDKAKDSILFIMVDFLRGITRPLLTWFLDLAALSITGYLLWVFKDRLADMTLKDGAEMLQASVNTIMFLASTASTYWFASRTHVGDIGKK